MRGEENSIQHPAQSTSATLAVLAGHSAQSTELAGVKLPEELQVPFVLGDTERGFECVDPVETCLSASRSSSDARAHLGARRFPRQLHLQALHAGEMIRAVALHAGLLGPLLHWLPSCEPCLSHSASSDKMKSATASSLASSSWLLKSCASLATICRTRFPKTCCLTMPRAVALRRAELDE